jgi:hypothetical protein
MWTLMTFVARLRYVAAREAAIEGDSVDPV